MAKNTKKAAAVDPKAEAKRERLQRAESVQFSVSEKNARQLAAFRGGRQFQRGDAGRPTEFAGKTPPNRGNV